MIIIYPKTETSRREFLERIVKLALGGATAATVGAIAYGIATRPPFSDYIFHGEIDGEHIALYSGRSSDLLYNSDLVIEVTRLDEKSNDTHPAVYNENYERLKNSLFGEPMNLPNHPATFYFGKSPNQFFYAANAENGIIKGPVKDMAQGRIKFDNYLRKIRELKPDVSLAGL